jgi:hypothetical protein
MNIAPIITPTADGGLELRPGDRVLFTGDTIPTGYVRVRLFWRWWLLREDFYDWFGLPALALFGPCTRSGNGLYEVQANDPDDGPWLMP